MQTVDTLNGINGATSMFAVIGETAAHILKRMDLTPNETNALDAEEAEEFRSVMRPYDS